MEHKNSAGFCVSSYMAKITINNSSTHKSGDFLQPPCPGWLLVLIFQTSSVHRLREDSRDAPSDQFTQLLIQYMVLFQLSFKYCSGLERLCSKSTIFKRKEVSLQNLAKFQSKYSVSKSYFASMDRTCGGFSGFYSVSRLHLLNQMVTAVMLLVAIFKPRPGCVLQV